MGFEVPIRPSCELSEQCQLQPRGQAGWVLSSRDQQFAFPCLQIVPTSHSSCRVGKEKESIILKRESRNRLGLV